MKKTIILCSLLAFVAFGSSKALSYPMPEFWEFNITDVEVLTFDPALFWGTDPNQTDNVQVFTPALNASNPVPLADGSEDNWGIAEITQIIDRSGTPTTVWSNTGIERLTAMVWGLDMHKITLVDSTADGNPDSIGIQMGVATFIDLNANNIYDLLIDIPIPFAGMSIWLDKTTDPGYTPYDLDGGDGGLDGPFDRTGFNTYPTVTDGKLQGNFAWAPGILANPLYMTDVDQDATFPPTGDGTGYADAIAGSGPLADLVDLDPFTTALGTTADISLVFDFWPHGISPETDFGWTLTSRDPVKGQAPEPATMLLLGSGLIGLAGLGRKKFLKKG